MDENKYPLRIVILEVTYELTPGVTEETCAETVRQAVEYLGGQIVSAVNISK
jgi:hypothetical protein